ncbi:hypothetical protein LDENG_00289940 [Lucifuga dentata]|nr:hypothetical protein LDENG_00289940 [Lucifuga dentata]
MKRLLLASALVAGLFGSLAANPFPAPSHPFCRTLWLFAMSCTDVSTKLMQQIQAFNPLNPCEECHYVLVSGTNVSVQAYHTSPEGFPAESLSFTLQTTILTGGCRVTAQSVSLSFTSPFDDGLNYCNLFNLLTASDLRNAPGFMEMTSEWACLGYGFATCEV